MNLSTHWMAKLVLPFILAMAAPFSANATVMTLSGNTVNYTFDDSLMGLFGTPEIAGDTLYFTPTDFTAISLGGQGPVSTTQSIAVQISLKPGYSFVSLSVLERGDYLLFGPGTNTADISGNLALMDNTHTLNLSLDSTSPLNITGLPTHNWEVVVADLTGWIPVIDLSLTNTLSASTDDVEGIAFVEKKYAGITVKTVPEPATLAIMLLGLALLGLRHRLKPAIVRTRS